MFQEVDNAELYSRAGLCLLVLHVIPVLGLCIVHCGLARLGVNKKLAKLLHAA